MEKKQLQKLEEGRKARRNVADRGDRRPGATLVTGEIRVIGAFEDHHIRIAVRRVIRGLNTHSRDHRGAHGRLDREARRRESADLITVATAVPVQVLGVLIIVDRVSDAFGATAVAGRSENQIARLSDVLGSWSKLLHRWKGPDDFP